MKNESKLYISDLDGTLLNSNKELSDYSKETLNLLITKGVKFSIATARTAASAIKILQGLNINLPVILMNGVVIYDVLENKYIKIEEIGLKEVKSILEILNENKLTGFMYSIKNDELTTYYENLNSIAMKDFYEERKTKYYKSFEEVDSFFSKVNSDRIIYFSLINEHDKLLEVYLKLKELSEIDAVMYRDIYADNIWYLEIHSKKASKYNAVKFLREYCNFDKIVGFGDNHNDIPLFKACDECYAVSNAVEELKEVATEVIGDNLSDSVVRFIEDVEVNITKINLKPKFKNRRIN